MEAKNWMQIRAALLAQFERLESDGRMRAGGFLRHDKALVSKRAAKAWFSLVPGMTHEELQALFAQPAAPVLQAAG